MEQQQHPPRPQPMPPAGHLPRGEQRTLLTRTYHRRTNAVTNVALVLCVASCLVYDWDTYLGTDKHVFSGIRPAVRRTMDWLYGLEPPPLPPPSERASARRAWQLQQAQKQDSFDA
jgi:hypothetical protein